MTTKTYVRRSKEAMPFDITLDRASLAAAHSARDAIKDITKIDASIPLIVRTALRYLSRHLQSLPKDPNAETARLHLKVDVLAASKGVAG